MVEVSRQKPKHVNLKIPVLLYNMIEELLPVFEFSITNVIVHILKEYENSEDHEKQLLKLSRANFIAMYRNWQIQGKLDEMRKKGLIKKEMED